MNRQNFLGHLMLALALIALAAFAGQMRRWQHHSQGVTVGTTTTMTSSSSGPRRFEKLTGAEVLVRFRPGTTVDRMRNIALRLNDRVEDEIEAVDGLAVIEDEDGLTAEEVAAQYRALSDLVEYAEPNYLIKLDQ